MNDAATPILSVRDLRVKLPFPDGGRVTVVRGVSFDVPERGFHALVGESGCGKSVTAMAIAGLPPADAPGAREGAALFRGRDLFSMPASELRALRRRDGIACVFQDPVSAFNPVMRVGAQLRETGATDAELRELLEATDLDAGILRRYPCELSGGMAQRACLVMALAQSPALLIADEPTTALDVISQRRVLDLLSKLCKARGAAVLLITHNLEIVAEYADTLSVLYAGAVAESGRVRDVLEKPAHPYTAALLRAIPRAGVAVNDLATIPGRVPPPREWSTAEPCVFRARCEFASRCTAPKAQCDFLRK